MKLYWCRTCGDGRNLGDVLGPTLLRHYGYRVSWAAPAQARVVSIGSVLSKPPPGWRGTVWGTGFIQEHMTRDLRRANVLAVRGELTRDACNLPRSTVLGDPGILAGDLLGPDATVAPDGPVVVVPHYVDRDLAARHPGAVRVDILDTPRAVLAAIAGASLVYTSSLHALIAADALGVPHVLEPHPAVVGAMFKFSDYASAFDAAITPGVVRLTDRGAMAERQAALRAAAAGLPR